MATTSIIILILTISCICFNIDNARKARRRRAARVLEYASQYPPHQYNEMSQEERTIELIGEEEFENMTMRIENILKRHSAQKCVCLNLTCGPDTEEGSVELHKILPGEDIQLVLCMEEGVDSIDAYHNGARIGRFTLMESFVVHKLMKFNHIRGTYIAQQNCYGIESSQDIKIILFYEPILDNGILKIKEDLDLNCNDSRMLDICEN